MRQYVRTLVLVCLGWLALGAQALEVQGVKFPETIDLGGGKLQLNGAGTRYKAVFKVYAAGLYLGKPSRNADEVLKQSGAKRITMTMLREINAEELGHLFIKGIRLNTPNEEYGRILESVMRMSQVFTDHKRLKAGGVITLDWLPSTGTVITVDGKSAGAPFKEAEFYTALLRIWVGADPADWQLKDALLGLPPKSASGG